MKWLLTIAMLMSYGTMTAFAIERETAAVEGEDSEAEVPFRVHRVRGKVVWQATALERLYGIQTVPEVKEQNLVLETPDGELVPLVEDIRGRAFRRDKRLRDIPVELLVRQYQGSPFIQIIKVFALEEDGKYELDYWCEICSIAMFELKACDCCQGPIEFRRQKAE